MSQFRKCRLGDVLTLQRGFDLPASQRSAGSVPVVSSSGITGYHSVAKVCGPGVVIGRYGTLGEVHFVKHDFWPLNTSLYVKDFKGNDARFCSYLLQTISVTGRSAAAAVPGVNRNVLHEVTVSCPPLPGQRRIASILGAYDDLIEVNRRRIALLEEMARRLYEEWFVHFRFPGGKGTSLRTVGEVRLPSGWELKPLATVASVNAHTIKPATAPTRIGYIDISSVSVGTVEKVEWMAFGDAPGRARRRVKDGSVIWSMVRPNRRSYALLLDPAPDTVASTGFAVLDGTALPFAYLFHAVTTDAFVGYLTGNATGAAYPAVTGAVFERAPIAVPPCDLTNQYAEATEPMLRLSSKLRATNQRLAASRDLLLPRLISGELTVTAAERELEDAA